MTTLILIVMAIIAITMPIIYGIHNKIEHHTNKKFSAWRAPVTWLITAIVVMVMGIIIIPETAEKQMIGNATEMIMFEDGTLYYDADDDVYFCVASDDWNPKKCYYKTYVDKNLAKEKIENHKKYIEYQEKVRFLFDKENQLWYTIMN